MDNVIEVKDQLDNVHYIRIYPEAVEVATQEPPPFSHTPVWVELPEDPEGLEGKACPVCHLRRSLTNRCECIEEGVVDA